MVVTIAWLCHFSTTAIRRPFPRGLDAIPGRRVPGVFRRTGFAGGDWVQVDIDYADEAGSRHPKARVSRGCRVNASLAFGCGLNAIPFNVPINRDSR